MPKKASSTLATKLKKTIKPSPTKPLWDGPCSDTRLGGVTQSMLSRYVVCKERFRINTIEGLYPTDSFNKSLEFGNMWHVCEERYANALDRKHHSGEYAWKAGCREYAEKLQRKYPMQQAEIVNWYRICLLEFPVYVKYWQKHPDVKSRTPLFQEEVFKVPFTLPSGRVVYLRGKFDSVDLIKEHPAGIWLQENKTKSGPNEQQIKRQLSFDLQTMIYLICLEETNSGRVLTAGMPKCYGQPIKGVRYNVIKRPLQYQGKKETAEEFYSRLQGIIEEKPEEWFMRWKVEITPEDIEEFKDTFLIPELENLCDDYEWWEYCLSHKLSPFADRVKHGVYGHYPRHSRRCFGIYDVLSEGGSTDLDEYLATGNRVGLTRRETMFDELEV